jgi:monoamine oxidase
MHAKRIAVIGGGPGGLMTAYLLEQKSPAPLDITLFEASDRVGGKIMSRWFNTAAVRYEAGTAELYDYSQLGFDPLRQLIETLQLPTDELFGSTVVLGNRIIRNRADIKRHFGKKTAQALARFYRQGRSLTSPLDYYHAGWPYDNKHPWIRRSFQSILTKVPDQTAKRFIEVAVHSDLATEPSMTHGLYGLENCLMDDPQYMRYYSIQGGLERLPQALRTRLAAQVELNRPVVRVAKTAARTYRVFSRQHGHISADDFDLVAMALPHAWLPTVAWGSRKLEAAMHAHYAYYDRPAHYLRITILFHKPFWRHLIPGTYFQLDAFGGCCVYDESARDEVGPYGVLSWLLSGHQALLMSNAPDTALIEAALASLPGALAAGQTLFLEGHVQRWIGTVSAQPGGYPIKGSKIRHVPEPTEHPGLIVIGDYLFDATINGTLDSADIATDLMLKYLGYPPASLILATSSRTAPHHSARAGGGGPSLASNNGKQRATKPVKQAFDATHVKGGVNDRAEHSCQNLLALSRV